MRCFALWLMAAAPACDSELREVDGGGAGANEGGSGAGGGGSAGADSSGGAGGGRAPNEPVCPDESPCIEETGCLLSGSESRCRNLACALPEPCPMIELSTNGEWGLSGPYQLETAEAFTCVMAALEQGTVGTYRWRVPSLNPPFDGYGQLGVLHVLDGRRGLESDDHAGDLGTLRFTLGPASLRPPSYFQSCASATGDAAFACISDWSDGCTDR